MIIWRGWGILGFLIPGFFLAGGFGLGQAVSDSDEPNLIFIGIMLLLAAGVVWFLGDWLNKKRPEVKVQEFVAQRGQELDQLVRAGNFHLGAGYAPPSSMQEAQVQAAQLLQAEEAELRKRGFNISTLFWIPMQWLAIPIAGLAVFAFISAFMG